MQGSGKGQQQPILCRYLYRVRAVIHLAMCGRHLADPSGHGHVHLWHSKHPDAVASSGHKYVAVYAHEQFISLIRIDEEKSTASGGADHGQIVKYDTTGVIMGCMMLTDSNGLVYLATFHCG